MKIVHFLGIGGAGTSSAAALAKENGFEVDGCDLDSNSVYLEELDKLNIDIQSNHQPSHVGGKYLIVTSAAIQVIQGKNTELLEARKRKIKIISTEKFVSDYLAKDKFMIAVAGTHGKSTTTAMIGQILENAGYDPTVYLGTVVTKWGKNYRFGKSKFFVLEADEYQDKFLNYNPNVGVITNIEYDHPDYFKNEEQLLKSFVNFVQNFRSESNLIVGVSPEESVNIRKLIESSDVIAKVAADHLSTQDMDFKLQIPGQHNRLNAASAYLCARELGIDEEIVRDSLSKFSGTARRFEFKGEESTVKIFDDYAHHPTEIAVTLKTLREEFPKEKIWCVFQPHTFSRTKVLFDDFVKVLSKANIDKLIIVDIFASREKDYGEVSSLDLTKKIKDAVYIGDTTEAGNYILKEVAEGDIVISMGAGDIYKLSEYLIEKLKGQNGKRDN